MAEHARAATGPDHARRGTTTVRDKAVHAIARRAATGVAGVCVHQGRLGGLGGRELPGVDVDVADHQVRARVELAVAWPQACRTVAAAVREQVHQALSTMAGLTVTTVEVTITTVLTPDQVPAPRRVLR